METLRNLLKAKMTTCVWVQTYETSYFLADLIEMLRLNDPEQSRNVLYLWDVASGLLRYSEEDRMFHVLSDSLSEADRTLAAKTMDPSFLMQYIMTQQNKPSATTAPVFVIENLHLLAGNPKIVQALLDIKRFPAKQNIPVLILGSQRTGIPEWNKAFTPFHYDLPNEQEIRRAILIFVNSLNKQRQKNGLDAFPEDAVNELVQAAKGLTISEIMDCCRKSRVEYKTLDVDMMTREKIQIIHNSGCLDYREIQDISLDDMGGSENFKRWLLELKDLLTPEARNFGLPAPKGFIAFGPPGSGKTFSAEITAKLFNLPLVEMNFGKILGSLVGQSERAIDQALQTIKAVAPCVVLIDESEKILGGHKSSYNSDSGTLARVLGRLLEFMNDNSDGVFFIMTSNDVSKLPPELLRSGRLDTQWYFGMPNTSERQSIFRIYFGKHQKTVSQELLEYAVDMTQNFTGAEIKAAVDIMLRKLWIRYQKDKTIDTNTFLKADVKDAVSEIVPVYRSAADTVTALQNYARTRARFASSKEESAVRTAIDAIDISI